MSDYRRYKLVPHACRACGGRILKSEADRTRTVWYRCADCGASAHDKIDNKHGHTALCFCGARMPGSSAFVLKCAINRSRSLEMPEEVVAVGVESEPQG